MLKNRDMSDVKLTQGIKRSANRLFGKINSKYNST